MNNKIKTYVGLGLIVIGVGLAGVSLYSNSNEELVVKNLNVHNEKDMTEEVYTILKEFKPTMKDNKINLKFNLDKVDGEWQTEEINIEIKDNNIEIWGDIVTNKHKEILRTDPSARVLFELLIKLTNYKAKSYNDYMKALNNRNLNNVDFKYVGDEIIYNLDLNYNK